MREKLSGILLVRIPKGTYRRGSFDGDDLARADEGPAHNIRIAEPFYMGQTEVTWAQWSRVMGDAIPEGVNDDIPVTGMSRTRILEFLAKTGLDLARESEWEFAARGGVNKNPIEADLNTMAWTIDNSGGNRSCIVR